jgi:hypothetical protein
MLLNLSLTYEYVHFRLQDALFLRTCLAINYYFRAPTDRYLLVSTISSIRCNNLFEESLYLW